MVVAWLDRKMDMKLPMKQDLKQKLLSGKGILQYCKIAIATALVFSEPFGATLSYMFGRFDTKFSPAI